MKKYTVHLSIYTSENLCGIYADDMYSAINEQIQIIEEWTHNLQGRIGVKK